jgi:hypothetical protein
VIATVVSSAPLPVVMKTMCVGVSVLVVVTTTSPLADAEAASADSAAEAILPHSPVLKVDGYE